MPICSVYSSGDRELLSDEALVEKVKSGDRQAFKELMRRYRNSVYVTIIRISKDTRDVEDIFQEVFIGSRAYNYRCHFCDYPIYDCYRKHQNMIGFSDDPQVKKAQESR
ncbi:MAG: hypothetical protein IBX64_13095 [Actinobacteria bacterium]|nr:hypothetical protein [Actinomycetota bacterium]